MSKLSDALNRHGFYNNWELLTRFGGPLDVAVEYSAAPRGRIGYGDCDRTTVWSPRNNPRLELGVRRRWGARGTAREFVGNRATTLQQAKDWTEQTFKYKLAPSPFGGYLPVAVVEAARHFLVLHSSRGVVHTPDRGRSGPPSQET